MRLHRGEAGLRQDARAALLFGQRDQLRRRARAAARHAVELRERSAHEGDRRRQQRAELAIARPEHVFDERRQLARHRVAQRPASTPGKSALLLLVMSSRLVPEPLPEEVGDRDARLADLASICARLRRDLGLAVQLAARRCVEQRVVGGRRPEQVREPRRQLELTERNQLAACVGRRAGRLETIEEVRRLERRADHHLDALGVAAAVSAGLVRRHQQLLVLRGRRAAKRAPAEAAWRTQRAHASSPFAAGSQAVSGGEVLRHRRLGQRLGDQHVLLGVQRRDRQHAGVVVEAVGDLVGGQIVRRAGIDVQQVAHRVRVFEARESSQRRRRDLVARAQRGARAAGAALARAVRAGAGSAGRTLAGAARHQRERAADPQQSRATAHSNLRRAPLRPVRRPVYTGQERGQAG